MAAPATHAALPAFPVRAGKGLTRQTDVLLKAPLRCPGSSIPEVAHPRLCPCRPWAHTWASVRVSGLTVSTTNRGTSGACSLAFGARCGAGCDQLSGSRQTGRPASPCPPLSCTPRRTDALPPHRASAETLGCAITHLLSSCLHPPPVLACALTVHRQTDTHTCVLPWPPPTLAQVTSWSKRPPLPGLTGLCVSL